MENEINLAWQQLGYAIIEQAVMDLDALKSAGVIADGGEVGPWPCRQDGKPRFISGFAHQHEAKELVLWLRSPGGAGYMLSMLGSRIQPDQMLRRLGLEKTAKAAARSCSSTSHFDLQDSAVFAISADRRRECHEAETA